MEKLVESLVEEDLDNTPITPVTSHPSYKSVPRLETAETVQAQLKSLIVQVLREANSLPSIHLNAARQNAGNAEHLKSKSYEDILATTILNKIVEKSQLTKGAPSETSEGRRNSQTKKSIKATCEFKLGPDGHSRQTVFTSSGDAGDVEEVNGWSGGGRTSLLCTTVEHIEEVITRYSPNEYEAEECAATSSLKQPTQSGVSKTLSGVQYKEGVHHRAPCPELGRDIVDGSALLEENRFDSDTEFNIGIEFINDLESWQENWLFQKKKLPRTHSTRSSVHHPVPVPMLVPCPGPDQTCRTLIGDVDAEETSDLSECSDSMYDDPIFKTSSPKTASSKRRSSGSKSRRSNSLKVAGSSSSEEDEDNTEDRWIEARNKELLLSTSPVDSGEGSLEILTEEESSLPLSNNGHENKPARPVPKPRKSATKSNTNADLQIKNSEPDITKRPRSNTSNESGPVNGQFKTKTTTQTFLENERNATSNKDTKQEIKTNGVIPNKTKLLPVELVKNGDAHEKSKSELKTTEQNRSADSKGGSSEFIQENNTDVKENEKIDPMHKDLNRHKETIENLRESKEINKNTNKQPSKTSGTVIQHGKIENHTNSESPNEQIDKTTKTEATNKSFNTKNNTKDDQNQTRNHNQNVIGNRDVVKPEETDEELKIHSDLKSTEYEKDNTKTYRTDVVDKSKIVDQENIPKSIKKDGHVPEQIEENLSNFNGEDHTNTDKCNNISAQIERRNSKEAVGIVHQSNEHINEASNQSTNESNHGLLEEEPIAKESYDREQEAEMREIEILNTPPKPGTIAEREHAKWLRAVPLENNPYSKENIEKRHRMKLFDLSRSASSDQTESNEETDHSRSESIIVTSSSSPDLIKRYSRDYYINNSIGCTPSHLSTSNTSLSSLGGGKPVAHPIKLVASSTPRTLPQPKQRSKELDDLKRPANVSSDENERVVSEDDVNIMNAHVYKDEVNEVGDNLKVDNEHQNLLGRNGELENEHENREFKVVTDVKSSNGDADENLSKDEINDVTSSDENLEIKEINSGRVFEDKYEAGDVRINKEMKSEANNTKGTKDNQSDVTKNGNTEEHEISNSIGESSRKAMERSATQSDFQKMQVKRTDPKYASVQTLPNMHTNEKPKKKKKSLFSSIRNFLTNKKSKSISKCESSKSLLFADKSLQNIYSDTWNQKQADQMKRESFDDELLETFRKSKLKQIENFILNEQKTVKGSEENNFDYLKNMNELNEKKNGKVVVNTCILDDAIEEKSELHNPNKTSPVPHEIPNKKLETQCDEEARIIISNAVKDIIVVDNHFEANGQRRKENGSSGNLKNSTVQNRTPIISITDADGSSTDESIEELTLKEVKNKFENEEMPNERDGTTSHTKKTFTSDNIETIGPKDSNKSNSSTLERQRNANSVPIQVVHEQTEHPCGDIIVHVDSDKSFEDVGDIQKNYCSFENDIDEDTSKNHEIHYNGILDISEDTRMHFIKEIDKIFEQEGLNITFEKDVTIDSFNETAEEYADLKESNKTNNKYANAIERINGIDDSPKTTLDRTLLKSKQEEIHSKIMKRHLLECKGQNMDITHVSVNDKTANSDNNLDSTVEKTDVIDNELNDIKDKIIEKFDVQNITMQKTFHVSTALQNDDVEDLDDNREADSSIIENDIYSDMNLEEYVLRNSLRHKTLKPKSSVATANFSVNPLYSNEELGEKSTTDNLKRPENTLTNESQIEKEENVDIRSNTGVESNANDSSDEFSFHARKTPESGYSSNVEIFSRINTPELMEEIPETVGGIQEMGSKEDQKLCVESVETDTLDMNKTVQRQILCQNFEKENEDGGTFHNNLEINESGFQENNTRGNHQNSGGIADERPFERSIDTFIRNEQSHSLLVRPDAPEECAIPLIANEEQHKPSILSTDNSQLLEPGILLNDSIIRERRNVILSTTTAKPDESEKQNGEVQKSQTETAKSLTEANNLIPDLNGQLSAEFDKLQRVFSRSLENLDDMKTDENDASAESNGLENLVENIGNPNINDFPNSDENRSEKADDIRDTFDYNLKQLCDGRNTFNFNTRL